MSVPCTNTGMDIFKSLHVNKMPDYIGITSLRIEFSPLVCEATRMVNDDWYLNRILIKKELQGQCIGRELMRRLQELLKAQGCKKLVVEPGGYGSSIVRLKKFYKSCGFKQLRHHMEWVP